MTDFIYSRVLCLLVTWRIFLPVKSSHQMLWLRSVVQSSLRNGFSFSAELSGSGFYYSDTRTEEE